MLVMIDNYDSFTYNLVQYFGQAGHTPRVIRNDEYEVDGVLDLRPSAIIISPGPGHPDAAGVCVPLLCHMITHVVTIPVFGVCLGHQAIAHAMGGSVIHAPCPVHGKTSAITHDGASVFKHIPSPVEVTRYHSLTVDPGNLPVDLEISAQTDGLIMGMAHKTLPIHSVQFHPESIATKHGFQMIENFIEIAQC